MLAAAQIFAVEGETEIRKRHRTNIFNIGGQENESNRGSRIR